MCKWDSLKQINICVEKDFETDIELIDFLATLPDTFDGCFMDYDIDDKLPESLFRFKNIVSVQFHSTTLTEIDSLFCKWDKMTNISYGIDKLVDIPHCLIEGSESLQFIQISVAKKPSANYIKNLRNYAAVIKPRQYRVIEINSEIIEFE